MTELQENEYNDSIRILTLEKSIIKERLGEINKTMLINHFKNFLRHNKTTYKKADIEKLTCKKIIIDRQCPEIFPGKTQFISIEYLVGNTSIIFYVSIFSINDDSCHELSIRINSKKVFKHIVATGIFEDILAEENDDGDENNIIGNTLYINKLEKNINLDKYFEELNSIINVVR